MVKVSEDLYRYFGFVIVKQDHPKLSSYVIYEESPKTRDLIFVDTAYSIEHFKQLINQNKHKFYLSAIKGVTLRQDIRGCFIYKYKKQ